MAGEGYEPVTVSRRIGWEPAGQGTAPARRQAFLLFLAFAPDAGLWPFTQM